MTLLADNKELTKETRYVSCLGTREILGGISRETYNMLGNAPFGFGLT